MNNKNGRLFLSNPTNQMSSEQRRKLKALMPSEPEDKPICKNGETCPLLDRIKALEEQVEEMEERLGLIEWDMD